MTRLREPGLSRLVHRLVRWRWALLAGWLALLGVAGLSALGLAGQLSGGGWYAPGSQSSRAVAAMNEGFVGRGESTLALVVRDERYTSADLGFAPRGQAVFEEVTSEPRLAVTSAYGWATTSGAAQAQLVGDDGRTTVTTLGLGLSDGDARRELPAIQASIDERYAGQGLLVSLVGPASLWGEINVLSEHGLLRAELLVLPLLVVIMLAIYRGWVAATMSLLVALTSVVWALGVLGVLAEHIELSIFVQNAATMLGLGVAVDYSLFVISRFREQVGDGDTTEQALVAALRTAGHTVLSAGATVMLAMGTLFLVDLPVIRSLALGAVVVVATGVLVNVVVLPALLAAFGHRVAHRRPRHRSARANDERWHRWAHRVMRYPVVSLTAGCALLGVLALPATQLSTFTPDARIVPESTSVRRGFDAVQTAFGPGTASPMNVVVRLDRPSTGSGAAELVDDLSTRLAGLDGASEVRSATTVLEAAGVPDVVDALGFSRRATLPDELADAVGHYASADGGVHVVEVLPDDTAASPTARELLDDVRAVTATLDGPGVEIAVGGETAEGIDGNQAIEDALPGVAATMLAVIYVLLLVTFRSVFLPLKAIAMNVASVAATYGVLVLVFQEGWGAGLLGFTESGHVTNFVPVLLLALLFSLSTDYEVFLLSRVREEWEAGADNRLAVARGLALTAPLISGAAVLMVAVFSAFALASVLPVQELGLGMAVAIVLDATVVRLVLVPASMQLMGRWNWWLPGLPGRAASGSPELQDA